jgi:hypothetical protein
LTGVCGGVPSVYVGHLGFALAGKGVRRDAPLWLLVLAAQGCDWLQVIACTRNPDTSAMWSHSVPAVAALVVAFALAGYLLTRSGAVALVGGAVALSHIAADYITGLKPTWPGGPVVGLDLYAHPAADFFVESVVIAAGWLLYRRSLPLEARSRRLTWALLVLLVGGQLVGVAKHLIFTPPPKCY